MESDLDRLQESTNASDEDDEQSGEDDSMTADARRRRFCNERQHVSPDGTEINITPKKFKYTEEISTTIGNDIRRYSKPSANSRVSKSVPFTKLRVRSHHRPHIKQPVSRHLPSDPSSVKKTYKPQLGIGDSSKSIFISKAPVIFINPKFIKKFVDKSLKFSSNPLGDMTSIETQQEGVETNAVDREIAMQESCLGICPKNSLQAAAMMTVVRLVTECIEDVSKRDEKMNRELANRILENMTKSRPLSRVQAGDIE